MIDALNTILIGALNILDRTVCWWSEVHSLMAKGLRVRVRTRVRAEARGCTIYLYLVLQSVVNIFVFVACFRASCDV